MRLILIDSEQKQGGRRYSVEDILPVPHYRAHPGAGRGSRGAGGASVCASPETKQIGACCALLCPAQACPAQPCPAQPKLCSGGLARHGALQHDDAVVLKVPSLRRFEIVEPSAGSFRIDAMIFPENEFMLGQAGNDIAGVRVWLHSEYCWVSQMKRCYKLTGIAKMLNWVES